MRQGQAFAPGVTDLGRNGVVHPLQVLRRGQRGALPGGRWIGEPADLEGGKRGVIHGVGELDIGRSGIMRVQQGYKSVIKG